MPANASMMPEISMKMPTINAAANDTNDLGVVADDLTIASILSLTCLAFAANAGAPRGASPPASNSRNASSERAYAPGAILPRFITSASQAWSALPRALRAAIQATGWKKYKAEIAA